MKDSFAKEDGLLPETALARHRTIGGHANSRSPVQGYRDSARAGEARCESCLPPTTRTVTAMEFWRGTSRPRGAAIREPEASES